MERYLENLGPSSLYRYFIWLVALNRFWTASHLTRRGLDHPEHCPLCDQEDENVQHLLTTFVFSRLVWYSVLCLVGLQQHTPGLDALSFIEWWRHAMQQIEKQHRKGFNSLVLLVTWWIWKHRNIYNACVF
jgi:hypothetical protein